MSFADIQTYNDRQTPEDKAICDILSATINAFPGFTECKIRHAHPVWFIDGNPIVGYSKQKRGMRLMFWSGQDFDEEELSVRGEKFKDASIFYNSGSEIDLDMLNRCLNKSKIIQRDYKNLIKRKGSLVKLS